MTWLDRLIDLFVVRLPAPPAPAIAVRFERGTPMRVALVGTVTLDAAPSSPAIASRPVAVTVNGVALPAVDYTAPFTFACNEGDDYSVKANNVAASGIASPDSVVGGKAMDSTVPPAPGITVTFAPAPAAS